MQIDDDWWRRGKPASDDAGDDEDSWADDEAEEAEVYPRCRACGAEFFDDETVRCPSCGSYQSTEDAPPARHSGWIILTAMLLVFLMLYAIMKH